MSAPNSLREFQLSFGRYLRADDTCPPPPCVDHTRAAIYKDLLNNNVAGFINQCFPVTRSLIPTPQWTQLCQHFFTEWRAPSPLFRDIPHQFLEFIQQSDYLDELPAWFTDLAHYEWVELYLETVHVDPIEPTLGKLTLNQPVIPLVYSCPVQQICVDWIPDKPQETYLIALRTATHDIKFISANAPTLLVLHELCESPLTEEALVQRLAVQLGRPCDDAFYHHCQQVIEQLTEQQVLL